MSEESFESEYTQYFDSIAKDCDISNLSEHALGALFWDKQQKKLDQKDKRIAELEKHNKEMLDAIKASCEYDDCWISEEYYVSNYYEGDPDIERYKIFKNIIKERGE